jgi:hypothetical protein
MLNTRTTQSPAPRNPPHNYRQPAAGLVQGPTVRNHRGAAAASDAQCSCRTAAVSCGLNAWLMSVGRCPVPPQDPQPPAAGLVRGPEARDQGGAAAAPAAHSDRTAGRGAGTGGREGGGSGPHAAAQRIHVGNRQQPEYDHAAAAGAQHPLDGCGAGMQ